MKYYVTVIENTDRSCVIEVEADSKNSAVERAEEMWHDGEITGENMEVCEGGEQFVAAFINES